MKQDTENTKESDSPSGDLNLPITHGSTFIHFPPMKPTQSGQSIIPWLKELFIDIVSGFFPGFLSAQDEGSIC